MKTNAHRGIVAFTALVLFTQAAIAAEAIKIISWNVESGGAKPATISQRMAGMDGVDLWGMSEVDSSWATALEQGAEAGENADFKPILGTTGGADRLLILYDSGRFDFLGKEELSAMNPGNHRSPLVVHLKLKSSGTEFKFMVNHLARGDNAVRHNQGTQLNAWAQTQTLPLVAVGDYNFDWDVNGGDTNHDEGYDNMTANGVWTWVRPPSLIKTQDSNFNSVLDFVFMHDPSNAFTESSQIIVVPGDFPDDANTPDHRPLEATLTLGGGTGPIPTPTVTKQQLLERITQIEADLAQLKALVQQMPN